MEMVWDEMEKKIVIEDCLEFLYFRNGIVVVVPTAP